jgi:hypothetical protein
VSYDPTTDAGLVRLLISDIGDDSPMFEDDEIRAFLDLEGGVVKLAAATALDTIASNEAMTAKVIKTLDLTTDGAKLSAELRARADTLRADVDANDDFAVAEYVDNPFAYRERILKNWLRNDAS